MKRKRNPSKKQGRLLTSFFSHSSIHNSKAKSNKLDQNDNYNSGSRFQSCPLCSKSFPVHLITSHASSCIGESTKPKADSIISDIESPLPNVPSTTVIRKEVILKWNASDGIAKIDQTLSKFAHLSPTEPLPGLYLFENFITEEEENAIVLHLDARQDENSTIGIDNSNPRNQIKYKDQCIPWKPSTFNGKHRGKRWGVHCNLRDKAVYPEQDPLPSAIVNIIDKIVHLNLPCMKGCTPNEANAIDYHRKSGHYLKSHVDDRQLSKEPIANLSLAGDCLMTFRHEKGTKKNVALPSMKKVLLKRRTLQILTGFTRYNYSHGISNKDLLTDRRISVTMRESPLSR